MNQRPSTVGLTKLLQGLVEKGVLEQKGQRRWAFYQLPPLPEELLHKEGDSAHLAGDSTHLAKDSTRLRVDSTHLISDSEQPVGDTDSANLSNIALPARQKKKLQKAEMERIILALCTGRYLTARAVGELLERNPNGLRDRYLRPMTADGRLGLRYPEDPNRPD